MIVSTGIATFHHVAVLLVFVSLRTLRKLIAVKIAISTTAATIPVAVSTVLAVAQLHPVLGERVMLAALDHRHDLDRGDGGSLQPREPAERGAREAAERVVREPCRAAGDRVHRAELGVDEREQHDRDRADAPRDDRGRSGGGERALRAEQPARADDRPARGPQQADEPDLALEARPPRPRALDTDDARPDTDIAHLRLPPSQLPIAARAARSKLRLPALAGARVR
jgi:hypothetical protein